MYRGSPCIISRHQQMDYVLQFNHSLAIENCLGRKISQDLMRRYRLQHMGGALLATIFNVWWVVSHAAEEAEQE